VKKLKELAENVSDSGPWRIFPTESDVGLEDTTPGVVSKHRRITFGLVECETEYIAAASPDVVLKLIERLEDAEVALFIWQSYLEDPDGIDPSSQHFKKWSDGDSP